MDAFTFHALGNASAVRDLFEGIVWITGAGDYSLVATLLVTIGFVLVLAAGSVRSDGKNVIPYFAAALLFWFVSIVPKATVVIEDNRSESVYTVDNVPLGIAFTASMASGLGSWLAEGYESAFVPVSSARFTRFGAVFPERVAEALKAAGPVTPEARTLLAAVTSACIAPEIMTDSTKATQLFESADLWATVSSDGWLNPARSVAMPDGTVAYCPAAVTEMNQVFETVELPALKRILGAKLAPDSADPSGVLAEVIPQAEGLLFGIARSLDASLRHAVVMTAVTEGVSKMALSSDATLSLAVGLAQAQGNLASEINYRTMAKIGADFLPKARNGFEIIVIGLFPVVVLIALVSGNFMGAILKSYLMILIALELWPCAASLVNFLMVERDAGVFTALLEAYGADSIAAAALIRETGASSQAVAGALMMAVPVVCYMIVCGGAVAIGQMTGTLISPAQSAAQSQGVGLAAGNITQGNASVGNVSANNVSANKSDGSIRATTSQTVVTQSAFGSVTRGEGGILTGMSRTSVNLGVSAQSAQSLDRLQSTSYASGFAGAATQSSRYSVSQSAGDMTSARRAFSTALNETVTDMTSHGARWTGTSAATTSVSASDLTEHSRANQVSEGFSVQSQGSYSAGRALGGGAEPAAAGGVAAAPFSSSAVASYGSVLAPSISPGGAASAPAAARIGLPSVGIKGQLQATDSQQLIDQATGKSAASSASEQRQAWQTVHEAASRIAATHSDAAVRSVAADFVKQLSATEVASEDRAASMTDSQSFSAGLAESLGGRAATTVDDSPELMREAASRFGSAEGALRALNNGVARSDLALSHFYGREDAVRQGEDFGAGALPAPTARSSDAEVAARSLLALSQVEHRSLLAGAGRTVRSEASAVQKESERTRSGQALTEVTVDRTAAEVTRQSQATAGDALYRRGLMMVAREAYRMDNADKNYALRNAFLAGVGYRNGDALQKSLDEKASVDPELHSAISAVGSKLSTQMNESDWKSLAAASKSR